jgi:hypothetical protein
MTMVFRTQGFIVGKKFGARSLAARLDLKNSTWPHGKL